MLVLPLFGIWKLLHESLGSFSLNRKLGMLLLGILESFILEAKKTSPWKLGNLLSEVWKASPWKFGKLLFRRLKSFCLEAWNAAPCNASSWEVEKLLLGILECFFYDDTTDTTFSMQPRDWNLICSFKKSKFAKKKENIFSTMNISYLKKNMRLPN